MKRKAKTKNANKLILRDCSLMPEKEFIKLPEKEFIKLMEDRIANMLKVLREDGLREAFSDGTGSLKKGVENE